MLTFHEKFNLGISPNVECKNCYREVNSFYFNISENRMIPGNNITNYCDFCNNTNRHPIPHIEIDNFQKEKDPRYLIL